MPSMSRTSKGAAFYGEGARKALKVVKCADCPTVFPAKGRKKRCSPCADVHEENRQLARRNKV